MNFKKCNIAICLLWLTSEFLLYGEPMKEFQLFEGTIKVVDILGKPVPDIAVYGIYKDLCLIWPRTPNSEHSIAWKQKYFANTDNEGIVHVIVPKGQWQFSAIGFTDNKAILCIDMNVDIEKHFSIILTPDIEFKSTFGLSSKNQSDSNCILERLFIKHKSIPLHRQLPTGTINKITFQTTQRKPFNLWGQGITEDRKIAFVVNFGKLKSGRSEALSLNQIILKNHKNSSFDFYWERRLQEGLTGIIQVHNQKRIVISNGDFSLGYSRSIGDLWCTFVPMYFKVSGAEKRHFEINDHLLLNLWTLNINQGAMTQLFLIDENGFHVKRLFSQDRKPLCYEVSINQNGNIFKNSPKPGDIQAFFKNLNLKGKETWNFSIPLEKVQNTWFHKTAFIERSGENYKVRVPVGLSCYADNLLEQMDQFGKRIAKTCGKKKDIKKTRLTLNIKSKCYATFNGSDITMPTNILFHNNPMTPHTLPHEMTHNYDLHHSGLQEAIVEISRSGNGYIMYGQESIWIFIDRMNEKNTKEIWYSDTSLYFWGYSQGGQQFLHQICKFEPILVSEGKKYGFTKDDIIPAMFSVLLKRNMFDISSKYGLCNEKTRYDRACNFVIQYLSTHKT